MDRESYVKQKTSQRAAQLLQQERFISGLLEDHIQRVHGRESLIISADNALGARPGLVRLGRSVVQPLMDRFSSQEIQAAPDGEL